MNDAAVRATRLRISLNDQNMQLRKITSELDKAIRYGAHDKARKLQVDLARVQRHKLETRDQLNASLAEYYAADGRAITILRGWTP